MHSSIDFRDRSTKNLSLARGHLDAFDAERLKYAALELRMCIEGICYDLLRMHRSEASYRSIRNWQPDKLMRELANIDPGIAGNRTITIDGPGLISPIVATEYRFDGKWVKENWHKLGNFLHTPTIANIETGSAPTVEIIRSRCEAIYLRLEEILSSEIFGIRIDRTLKIECDCGFVIEREKSQLESGKNLSCPNCEAEYVYELTDEYVKYKFKSGEWICDNCGANNQIPIHKIKVGSQTTCALCNSNFNIFARFSLKRAQ